MFRGDWMETIAADFFLEAWRPAKKTGAISLFLHFGDLRNLVCVRGRRILPALQLLASQAEIAPLQRRNWPNHHECRTLPEKISGNRL